MPTWGMFSQTVLFFKTVAILNHSSVYAERERAINFWTRDLRLYSNISIESLHVRLLAGPSKDRFDASIAFRVSAAPFYLRTTRKQVSTIITSPTS
ncbi:hypothetical protein BDZ89DRAFT_73947 [Hymenopellis radicata]|nr:hypothetical protein BDZ89DRAFT_73947 [Hymenopellis radicata]